jgi:hypothetical protein
LQAFKLLDGNLLVALDGTDYYSSQKVSCPCCSTRTSRQGQVTYSHKALLPVIVAPAQSAVISLPPAFITPQDGHNKQDCEQTAAKRWIGTARAIFGEQPVTLLADDLFSRQPMCEAALAPGFNFIFVCLPESHPALYDWIAFNEASGHLKTLEQLGLFVSHGASSSGRALSTDSAAAGHSQRLLSRHLDPYQVLVV